MSYDTALAERVRKVVATETGLSEKAMFGGLAFLLHGRMAVAVSGRGGLMVRCDPDRTEQLLAPPSVERMVMRGRELDGWLRVHGDAVASDDTLRTWVAEGVGYVRSLPA